MRIDEDFEKENGWLKNKNKRNGREKTKKKRTNVRNCGKKKKLKRIKKGEKEKEDGKQLWSKLKELNNNFAKIK